MTTFQRKDFFLLLLVHSLFVYSYYSVSNKLSPPSSAMAAASTLSAAAVAGVCS